MGEVAWVWHLELVYIERELITREKIGENYSRDNSTPLKTIRTSLQASKITIWQKGSVNLKGELSPRQHIELAT